MTPIYTVFIKKACDKKKPPRSTLRGGFFHPLRRV